MRSSAYGRQRKESGVLAGPYASLSVVVVSSGSALVAQKATQALNAASRDLAPQLILVSQNSDPSLATSVERSGAEFIVAPAGSSRAEMCDLGMSRAVGSIVAVRDDYAIGNAAWLDTYRAVLTRNKAPVPVATPKESVVMDTLVAGRAVRADSSESLTSLEASRDAIGMAAAV